MFESVKKTDVRFALTVFLIVGAIALLALIFTVEIPARNSDMAHLFVGAYLGWTGSVVYFWVGTSKGSQDKQEELNEIRKDGAR